MSEGGRTARHGFVRKVLTQPVTTVADLLVPSMVEAVDLDETLARVNVDELLSRVDVDALVQRIDIDALLERVDIDALLQRVDVDALTDRIDVDSLVRRMQLGSVVKRGAEGVLASLLDLVRRQVVGMDVIVLDLVARVTRKKGAPVLAGPALLAADPSKGSEPRVSGRYAGPVSRLLAFAIDVAFVLVTFAVGAAIFSYVVRLLTGHQFARGGASDPWWIVALALWFVAYMWGGLASAGRTFGKMILGLRVVAVDGSPIAQRQSFLRVLMLPLNVLLLGLGFLIGASGSNRRSLHDRLTKTCVVYDWGDRPAEMPAPLTRWLSGKGAL